MPYCLKKQHRIYYEIHGKKDSPPILLIHGLGSSSQDWTLQIPALESHFFVITLDLTGHGKSSRPKKKVSIRDFALDCIQVLDHLSVSRTHLLGLSLGCFTGFELITSFPHRFLSFIGVNGTASIKLTNAKARWQGISRLLTVLFLGTRAMGRRIANAVLPQPENTAMRKMIIERISQNNRWIYLKILFGMVGWNVEAKVNRVTIPVLLIAADQDYTSISQKEAIITQIPNGQLAIIPNSHHLVNIEKKDEFNNLMLDFLSKTKDLH